MLLATDLDGTFLGGNINQRRNLYNWIKLNKEVKLVFVTGRGLKSVLPLLEDKSIPNPDYIICDVGSTVVNAMGLETIHHIQDDIEFKWPGTDFVIKKFKKYNELQVQQVPQERRCSFLISQTKNIAKIIKDAESINCDVIYSAGKFLDIVPRNVNKGTTLKQLITWIKYAEENVIVAGDTLNDLEMFNTGYKGVVVGNSEQSLKKQTSHHDHIYQARSYGAGGIFEAIKHFNLDQVNKISDRSTVPVKKVKDTNQLIVVYHRFPYEVKYENGKRVKEKSKSPNGIIPTLQSFFANGRPGYWVAWEEVLNYNESLPDMKIDEKKYPYLISSPIGLKKSEIEIFYKRFSKETFWPVIFSFVDKFKIDHKHWEVFRNVNIKFAEKIGKCAEQNAIIWIHDYNLWLVPGFLKEKRPDLKISFFHHTSFPPASIFNILPWRNEIIASLLSCDHVGFHIPRYVENFVDVARSVFPLRINKVISASPKFLTYSTPLGVDRITTEIQCNSHKIRLSANPVGVDVDYVKMLLQKPSVKSEIKKLSKHFGKQNVILSVERLDYVKGPVEKILAFEKFLDENPDFHGKLTLVNICTPAADGMKIYDKTKQELEQAVGRINGKFSKIEWVPIRLFFKSIPFDELLAYYAIAKIAWITPLRDGLNLVAKEFVATQGLIKDAMGTLILSEFAGASIDLHGALLTNPYDMQSLKNTLYQALHLSSDERIKRKKQLFDQVSKNDINQWAKNYNEEFMSMI